MTSRHTHRLLPFALSLAALALLPGCAPKKTATDAIAIGEFASLTGKDSSFGQATHHGTQLAIEEVNASGGVLGKKISFITDDDESNPGESATIAKKLIARDHVVALLGEFASSRSLEAAPIAQAAKIPMLSPGSTNPAVTQVGDYIFRACFIDPFQGTVLAKFAVSHLKVSRVAVLTSVTSAYSAGLSKYFRDQFAKDGGRIVADQKYSEGDTDFRAQLTAIAAAKPDAIFIPGYYTEVALIARQARELGLNVPLFGGDGWQAPQLLSIGGPAVEGCYFSTHYSPDSPAPEVQAFVKKYRDRYDGQTPDALSALGYDAANILIDAIRRAGSADPAKIRDALAATKDFDGATGRISIDADRNASKPAVILEVKNGKFVFVESVAP